MTAVLNGDRTHDLAKLPFRLVPDAQNGGHGIQYEQLTEMPYPGVPAKMVVHTIYCDTGTGPMPLPQIIDLMRMYWELEASLAGIIKERDDALAAKVIAEGEASRSNSRVEEYKRQIANLKKDKG